VRYLSIIAVSALVLPSLGCRTVGKVMIDAVFDAIFDSDDDCEDNDEVEIDPEILKRKGIELGSKRHKRLVFEETFNRDMQRAWNKKEEPDPVPKFNPDWSSVGSQTPLVD